MHVCYASENLTHGEANAKILKTWFFAVFLIQTQVLGDYQLILSMFSFLNKLYNTKFAS